MKILLVDRSGRGHAIADAMVRTNSEVIIHYAPGCAAIDNPRIRSFQELTLSDPARHVEHAVRERVDLVIVTNAVALANGFVDAFRNAGLPVVGPDRLASKLEWSKAFAKALFVRYGIATPAHWAFKSVQEARDFVRKAPWELVIKADGLCGGNGAFVCDDTEQALAAVERLMVERVFGSAGDRVVIERRISGKEFSFFALLDGEGFVSLPMALDYPKSDDGNRGVVSGGVGAVSHPPFESEYLTRKVETALLSPLMKCIRENKLHYTGPIYLGCMLVEDEPVLLEVNARLGDPEAEVILPRVTSDFVDACFAMNERRISQVGLTFSDVHFCDVVATQGPTNGFPGWPFGDFERGYPISGIEAVSPADCAIFLGEATGVPGPGLVSDGGRVLHVVGRGSSMRQAAERSRAGIRHIAFEGMRFRDDIGLVMPWDVAVS